MDVADILARSEGRHDWRETRIRDFPEVISNVNVCGEAGVDGCNRATAVDNGGRACAGKPPPAKEPQTCHFCLPN